MTGFGRPVFDIPMNSLNMLRVTSFEFVFENGAYSASDARQRSALADAAGFQLQAPGRKVRNITCVRP